VIVFKKSNFENVNLTMVKFILLLKLFLRKFFIIFHIFQFYYLNFKRCARRSFKIAYEDRKHLTVKLICKDSLKIDSQQKAAS
jgi:hypothetical protein